MASRKITCSECGTSGCIQEFVNANVHEHPELKEKIRNGSAFLWECPHCGHANLSVSQMLYHDPDEKLMIWLLPESMSEAEKELVGKGMEAITGQIAADAGVMQGYTLRRVSEAGELIEKINIHDAGLDDVVMEMCKYVTKMELAGKEADKEKAGSVMAAPFKFYRTEGPDNDITLTYPLDGQMQGVKIGFNVYEDCAGIVRRNPDVRPAPGFATVNASWLSSKIR